MASGSEPRILIVEDSLDLRYLMKRLLDGEGYETLTAGNGEEALSMLESLDPLPCALVLDLMMPGMDGFEFRREQRNRARIADIPVLVLTAGRVSDSEASRLSPCEFQSKPVDIEDLMRAVERICGKTTDVTSREA